MAAAWFNAIADPTKAIAISAGTEPAEHVHAGVVTAMREVGVDLSAAQPQRLTQQLAEGAQLLVTMGCGDACPYVPGVARLDWALQDPKDLPLDQVRRIRDEIRARVGALLVQREWQRAPNEQPSLLREQ